MARRTAAGLTDKQERFCREYLIDLNATQAAIRAGYSARGASVQGSTLLGNPKVQGRLHELQGERNERLEWDADRVLRELIDLAEFDLVDCFTEEGGLRAIHEIPALARKSITAIESVELFEMNRGNREQVGETKKLKLNDRRATLQLIGQHIGIQAWKHQVGTDEPLVVWHNYAGEAGTGGRDADSEDT